MAADVAALFVDARGPYPTLLGPNWCWDIARDARTYSGPAPVVAHPPCRNWGKLRHLATGDDSDCGPIAVSLVRRFGGVLEHPAGSLLWSACGMPRPGELPDAWGGRTVQVDQVRWGHVARKPTWLYIVGPCVFGPLPPKRAPTHYVSGARERKIKTGGTVPPGIKICSSQQRRRTPKAFAELLIRLARSAGEARRGR